jgi:hypothetical protein
MLPLLPSAETGVLRVCRLLALPAAGFAAVAWLNLKAISRWEGSGREGGVRPMAVRLAIVCGACSIALASAEPRLALLLAMLTVSSLLLAWLDGMRRRMDAVTLRAAADLVLLTPLVLVPVELVR